MTVPVTSEEVIDYLGDTAGSYDQAAIDQALAAEAADQAARCRITDTDPQPALVEALCRRVAHNLAIRALPLGVQATITDAAVATVSVGGLDAEVRRLEAPHRKRVVG